MNPGQFEGADFKSGVCQLVSVEHFLLWHKIQYGGLWPSENMIFR